jgi:hypothetical protein
MAGTVLAALSGDVERKAAAAIASAREKHERACADHAKLTTEHADARDAFEASGSDSDAARLQRLAMRVDRAERLRSAAAAEVAMAEHNATIAGLEGNARSALTAERDATTADATQAHALAALVATAAALAADLTAAIGRSTASSTAAAARRDEARTAIAALRATAPDRAAPLDVELRSRLASAAARSRVRDRATPLAGLHVRLSALAALAGDRARALIAEHTAVANIIGEHPLPPSAAAQIFDAALVGDRPEPDRVMRWLCLLLGTPSVGVPPWPSAQVDDTDRATLREHAVSVLWEHSERSPEATAAIDRWLAETAPERDRRTDKRSAEAARASAERDERERVKRWGGASIDVGARPAPMPGREHIATITPTGELVAPRDDAA